MFIFQVTTKMYEPNSIYSATGTGKLMGGMYNLLALQPYLKEGQMILNLRSEVKLNEFAEHLSLTKMGGEVTKIKMVKGGESEFTIHFTKGNLRFSNDAGELTPGIKSANNLSEGFVKITANEKEKRMEITVYDKNMKPVVNIRSDSYTEKTVGFVLGIDDAKLVSMPFSAKTSVDVRSTGSLETANKRVKEIESLKNGPDIYYMEEGISGKMVKLNLNTAKLVQSNWEYSGKTMTDFGFEVTGENGKKYYLTSTEMINFAASLEIGKKSIMLQGAGGSLKGKNVDEIIIDPLTHEIKYSVGGKLYVRDTDNNKTGYREIKPE